MLIDLDELVQKYTGCQHCYYGYDNYDQAIIDDRCFEDRNVNLRAKVMPRFDHCKLVRVYAGKLPAGTINCVTLYGVQKRNTRIYISCNENRVYQITGARTMVLAFYGELEVCNFDGIIVAHYVNFIVSPGRYRVAVKNINTVYLKYVIFERDHDRFYSDKQLQIMWNYVYPGQRPKNKYLIHFQPAKTTYNKYFRYISQNEIYEKCSYNELIVTDVYCVLRFTT